MTRGDQRQCPDPRIGKCSTSAASTGITAEVEVIPIQKLNEAYDRLFESNVKYRFAIDMASLANE